MSSDLQAASDFSWSIVGHEWATHLLQRAIGPMSANGRARATGPRHAYLLLGPAQVGKGTLAQLFAQALLCRADGMRPCGQCRSCRLMARAGHPDFRLVQPVDKDGNVDRSNGTLRVEQAADIIHDASLKPVESHYKVFVIQDFHQANDSFANKLLKTLEEPPEHVILCLTALDRSGLLATIVSRCQVLELRPLSPEVVRDGLVEGWQANPDQAELLARLSNGRFGWAVQQLGDQEGTSWRVSELEKLWNLVETDRVERLLWAEKLSANRNDHYLFRMLELWTTWWRDVMLAQSGCLENCSNIDHEAEIERHAGQIPASDIQSYLHTLNRIEGYLRHTVNIRLALDVLLLRLPQLAR